MRVIVVVLLAAIVTACSGLEPLMRNEVSAKVDTTAQVGINNVSSKYDIGDAKTAGVLTTTETTAQLQVQGNAYKLEQTFTPSTSLIASMFAGAVITSIGVVLGRKQ